MYFQLILPSLHQILTEYTMANIYKNKDIPKFMLDKRYLLGSVFFIFTFSVLFMLIYTPFSMTAWFSLKDTEHFGMTAAFTAHVDEVAGAASAIRVCAITVIVIGVLNWFFIEDTKKEENTESLGEVVKGMFKCLALPKVWILVGIIFTAYHSFSTDNKTIFKNFISTNKFSS